MEAFATSEDYLASCDMPDGMDAERLDALLARASRKIAARLRASGIEWEGRGADFADLLRDTACAMVQRAVGDGGDDGMGGQIPFGATQLSRGAGTYTRSFSVANPYGDLFMTRDEMEALGIGAPRAAVVSSVGW